MKKFFSKKATANSDAVNTAASAPATEMEKAADNAPKKITYTRLFIRDFLEIALGTLIPLLLFGKILGLSICPSPSMCPTIPVGEIYVINRLVAQDEQARGTIINFWDSEHTHHICKRVIGVPGILCPFTMGRSISTGRSWTRASIWSRASSLGGTWILPSPRGGTLSWGTTVTIPMTAVIGCSPWFTRKIFWAFIWLASISPSSAPPLPPLSPGNRLPVDPPRPLP